MIKRMMLVNFILAGFVSTLLPKQAQALDYYEKRLLQGVVRLDVIRLGDIQDVGAGIIAGVEGSTAYIITALHVLTGPEDEQNTSGWERRTDDIKINVRFFGDPKPYAGKLVDQWDEKMDLAVIKIDNPTIATSAIAVGFAIGSPTTLAPPYPALAIGHGGRQDWGRIGTRVTSVNGPTIRVSTTRVKPGDSGGALIDVSRNILIGMITRTSHTGSEAISAKFITSKLDSWGIAHHLRVTRVSTPMVRVPAGYFKMGAGVSGQSSASSRDIYLDAYFIDKYEVTVADFRRFIKATGYDYRPGIKTCNYAHKDRVNYPMNCVTWNDANAYAEWAGKQLPTEAQWEKAARGETGSIYPWGNLPLTKNDAALRTEWPVAVGSYQRDRSIYGVMDMLGNVSEWVADWYSSYYLQQLDAKNPTGPAAGISHDRVLRGASFETTLQNANLAIRKRNLPDFGRMRFDYGFRCVLNEAK